MSIITAFSIAALITTQAVNFLLSLSPVYSRYINSTTHDYAGLSAEQVKAVKAAFAANDHLLDPLPAALEAIRSGGAATLALRTAAPGAPLDPGAARAPSAPSAPGAPLDMNKIYDPIAQ